MTYRQAVVARPFRLAGAGRAAQRGLPEHEEGHAT
jgi:hypothetical protein